MKTAYKSPALRSAKTETPIDPADLALRGLAFLAADDERVARFLALTGLGPGELRGLVNDSGFHLAVLDHFAADEALLLAFSAAETLPPDAINRARRALGGGET